MTKNTMCLVPSDIHANMKVLAFLKKITLKSAMAMALEEYLSKPEHVSMLTVLGDRFYKQPATDPEPIATIPTFVEVEVPSVRPTEEPIIDPNATEYLSDEETAEWA